jgi:similarities with mutator mutT protein homolog and NTP pyrophosphohydrolase
MVLKDIKAAYRVVVKGIVRDDDGKVLFVQERSDSWDLPGGGLEHGEGLLDALNREFAEELKTEVEIDYKNPIIIPTWNTKFDDPVLIIAFGVKILSKPQLTDDVSDFKYYSLDQARQSILDSTLVNVISKFY